MATVILVGTLDTKGEEYGWLRTQLETAGRSVVSIDVGSFTEDLPADIGAVEVAGRSGVDLGPLLEAANAAPIDT